MNPTSSFDTLPLKESETKLISQVAASIKAQDDLEQIRRKLLRVGELLTQSTLFWVFIVLLALTVRNFGMNIGLYVFSIAALCIALFSTAAAFQHDRLRRDGEIIFDELSNELESTPDTLPRQAELDLRIVMRTFVAASDLPLLQTRNAAAIYVLINLFSVVLSLLFIR